jgi:hypothetical protein
MMKINIDWAPVLPFVNLVKSNLKEGIVVAEVGTWKGDTAIHYIEDIKAFNGKAYLIDWFKGCEGWFPDHGVHAFSEDEQKVDELYTACCNNVKALSCEDSCQVIKSCSWEAAQFIDDNSLDICFIDADHSYESCKKDIQAFLPKVKKPNGIMCGHDYDSAHPGVMQAVKELFLDKGISVEVLIPPDDKTSQGPPCWLVNFR